LRSTADNASTPDNLHGWGVVDAAAALAWLQAADLAPPEVVAPGAWRLAAAVPNPFNPATRIEYHVAVPARVMLRILDPRGRLVRLLLQDDRGTGMHAVRWDGTGGDGRRVASGLYLARLEAVDAAGATLFTDTKRLVLAK
jgi:hypothetical protein